MVSDQILNLGGLALTSSNTVRSVRFLPVKREFFLPTVANCLLIGGRLISQYYCRVFILEYKALR